MTTLALLLFLSMPPQPEFWFCRPVWTHCPPVPPHCGHHKCKGIT